MPGEEQEQERFEDYLALDRYLDPWRLVERRAYQRR